MSQSDVSQSDETPASGDRRDGGAGPDDRTPEESLSDRLAPDLLVDRYGERIYRVARRMTGNDADAEDVTQNVLIKILEKGHTYRGDAYPMGWIYRIAMNESREHFRRRGRRPSVSLDALPIDVDETSHLLGVSDFGARPEKEALRAEIEDVVGRAIAELPDGYRETVILMDLEGLSYKDAAEALDLTLGGFKTRLHRARLHLRRRLEEFWRSTDQAGTSSSSPEDA